MCRKIRIIQHDPNPEVEVHTFREAAHRLPLRFHGHYVTGCTAGGKHTLFRRISAPEAKP